MVKILEIVKILALVNILELMKIIAMVKILAMVNILPMMKIVMVENTDCRITGIGENTSTAKNSFTGANTGMPIFQTFSETLKRLGTLCTAYYSAV